MTYLAAHPEIIRGIALLCGSLGLGCMAFWLLDQFTQWYEERRRVRERRGQEAWDALMAARKQLGKGRKP